MIDLSKHDLEIVRAIINKHIPQYEVWVFGSRVNGKVKKFSDLDLAIVGKDPVSDDVLADLNNAFSESDLPIRVDVVDWATISPAFRNIIKQNYEIL